MNLLVERFNEQAGYAALKAGPHISTRICVSVQPQNEVLRFVQDTMEVTVGGLAFAPVPWASFGEFSSGGGTIADTLDIVLDGKYLADSSYGELNDVLRKVIQYPLRGRPVQVGRIILDLNTFEGISLQPLFVGTIHNSPLSFEDGPNMTITCASYRNAAHRQAPQLHSDVGHQERYPGDGAAKHMSDAIARGGTYPWNTVISSGGGAAPATAPLRPSRNRTVNPRLF